MWQGRTHWFVCHDAFTCVPQLIYTCARTHCVLMCPCVCLKCHVCVCSWRRILVFGNTEIMCLGVLDYTSVCRSICLSVCLAFLYVCMHICMYARAHICYSCVLILMWWPNRRHLKRMCLLQCADICTTYPVKTKTKHTKSRGFCHNTLPCARLNQRENKSKELTKKETWEGYVCREMFTCARIASWKSQIRTRHKSE